VREGVNETITKGLMGRGRARNGKNKTGEVILRVEMGKWTHDLTQKLIEAVDAALEEDEREERGDD
jgi:hypothetical protein